MITLDEFIEQGRMEWGSRNAFVREPGFHSLYVRHSHRVGKPNATKLTPFIDIASVTVTHSGQGTFKALVTKLHSAGHNIYVESVLSPLFGQGLLRMGFSQCRDVYPPSYFLLTTDDLHINTRPGQ
jgi:hypothetical protein